MASEWPLVPLRDAADVLTGFPFKGCTYLPSKSGIRVVRGDNVTEGRIRWGEKEKCWPSITSDLKPYVLMPDDLVIGMDGSRVGRNFATISVEDKGALLAQRVARLRAKGPMHQSFLKYSVCNQNFTNYVRSIHTGTSIPHISKGQIQDFPVFLPPLNEQNAIANTLGALDKRIDHNRTLAANLEAIARRLFKSWFVDFDPVSAKVAGEKPAGLADDIAALFPDRFVESEIGDVPDGWVSAKLVDLIEVERGLSYKGAGLADRETGKPMHNLNSVLEGGGYKYAGIKFYSGDFKERHLAKAGDIIVANTEQGHKHMLIGFPAIIPASYDEGLFSHHLYRVRILPEADVTKYWIYHALMAPDVREQLIGHANGSTVNMLKATGLQVPLVVVPPVRLCQQFDDIARALYERIESCVSESEVLVNLRDLLLPRLISGKLRVEDAEAMIEEAVA
ncbi:MAG: hypothetical protein CTY13_00285 [Methylobacter sp.]|nr:MAG: hypothetical protein CTY13_00285 [Methylobacter sp.]